MSCIGKWRWPQWPPTEAILAENRVSVVCWLDDDDDDDDNDDDDDDDDDKNNT